LPTNVEVPGEPFLLNFIAVVVSTCAFGRMPGFVAMAESSIVSALYFDPVYSFKLTNWADFLAIAAYAAMAALSVEAFGRLVDSALEANSAGALHRETQARLAAIVTSSGDAIVGKTLEGIVTSWNDAAERVFGYAADEMIGQSIRRLIPSDRQSEEDTILASLARGERIENYETIRITKDGRRINVSVTVSPLRDSEGRLIGASKIVRDITARRRTEARLAEREAQLALFVEHAPAAIAMFDSEMRYLAVSRRFLSDYELGDLGEVIGRSQYEIFPDMPPRWRDIHVRVLAGEELSNDEDFYPRQDGRILWVRWSMKPWRTADGRIGGAMLFAEVITEQVEARRALADSEARFRATFENAAVGIAHGAPDGRWLRVNQALCRILGYPVRELIKKSFQDVTYPADLAAEVAKVELMHEGKINSYEVDKRYLRKDGAIIWGRKTVGCVRKADRSIDYFVSVIEDISARKHAEELLKRQADLLDQSHDAIFTWKIGGGIAYWSRGAEALYGYTADEAIGQSSHALLRTRSPIPTQEVEAQIAREGSWYGELTHTTRDGRVIVVESRHVRVCYAGETHALETNRDITARKRAEARLAEREAQLALFVENAPAAIAMFDSEMRYLAVSRRFLSDYKLPAATEVIGRLHYEIFPDIPQRWRKIHARVLAGEELGHEDDPFPRQGGRFGLVQWSMKPWRTADGRIGGAMLFSQFMTNTLADTEARFRATFENAAVGIAHVAPDGRWLRVNESLCRILGYPADELLARSFQDVTHPDDLAADLAQVELMHNGKIGSYDVEKRYLRKDGTIIWGRETVSCVRKGDRSIDYLVSVVEDVSARKQAEAELRKSEERFRSSVLWSPLPMVLFDDREQILALSQSWVEETGYSREELRRIEDWTARAYGERAGEVLEQIRQIIPAQPQVVQVERMIRTKSGRERLWNFVSSALGIQSDGRRVFVSVAQDVTERKAHEKQIRLLMREVNHRAKNMLSLVQAIARQTAAREPENFIERFTERIRALAANQDLLVRNEWHGVDVEDLVRAQLAHFSDLIGSRIAMHGHRVRLNAAASQAVGLALHELATNAGKYGALSTDKGRVDVRWRTDRDTLTMSWTERKGPPVSPPKRQGFGSTVIASMVEATVGGEVQLNYAPSGLVWRLTCPAANALEQNARHKNSEPSTTRAGNCGVRHSPAMVH
jgi:PAS domain S-box-containing protein